MFVCLFLSVMSLFIDHNFGLFNTQNLFKPCAHHYKLLRRYSKIDDHKCAIITVWYF